MLNGGAEVNRALVEEHRVSLYPTYALLNARGERIASWMGFGSPEEWAQKLTALAADPLTLPERRARLAQSPTFRDALVLGEEARQSQRYREAEGHLRQARALDPAAAREAEVMLQIARGAYDGAGQGQYSIAEASAILTEALQAPDAGTTWPLTISEWLFGAVNQGAVPVAAVEPILTLAHPMALAISDERLQARRRGVLIDYAFHIERDPEQALGLKREALPAGWESDPVQLNGFAWWCFEHQVNYPEAEQLARRAVELAPPGPDLADNLDTLAQLVHARGDTQEALALITRGLEQNPGSAYLKEQEARFRGLLAAQGGR